jgi:hypothetical protein
MPTIILIDLIRLYIMVLEVRFGAMGGPEMIRAVRANPMVLDPRQAMRHGVSAWHALARNRRGETSIARSN